MGFFSMTGCLRAHWVKSLQARNEPSHQGVSMVHTRGIQNFLDPPSQSYSQQLGSATARLGTTHGGSSGGSGWHQPPARIPTL